MLSTRYLTVENGRHRQYEDKTTCVFLLNETCFRNYLLPRKRERVLQNLDKLHILKTPKQIQTDFQTHSFHNS